MFYKLLAMLLVVAGLIWIGADQTTLLVAGLLLAVNNLLAWLIKFAFKPTTSKPSYYVDKGTQNPFSL